MQSACVFCGHGSEILLLIFSVKTPITAFFKNFKTTQMYEHEPIRTFLETRCKKQNETKTRESVTSLINLAPSEKLQLPVLVEQQGYGQNEY